MPRVHGQQHLGVAVGGEFEAVGLELGPQLAKVVELAVVGDPVAVAGVGHRLSASRARVEDAEPPVSERRRKPPVVRREQLHPLAVGPPVSQDLGHRLDQAPIGAADEAADAAHV